MIEDKSRSRGDEAPQPANDNGAHSGEALDPRIRRIAEAIGRQIAREHAKRPPAANDNKPQRK